MMINTNTTSTRFILTKKVPLAVSKRSASLPFQRESSSSHLRTFVAKSVHRSGHGR